MRVDWTLVTGPQVEPLTLDEAKQHASIHQDDDNALIDAYLRAAREAAESHLGRALYTQTWKLELGGFADVMWLPMAAPLQSVTHVKYYDEAGVLQTLAQSYYTVDTTSTPGRVVRAPEQSWPSVQSDRLMPVVITYVCGWSSVDSIPELIKQGLRVYLAGVESDRMDGEAALRAARACWDLVGRVEWREPECWLWR